jgi:squalene-associated FAD-dependent desaturase
MNNHDNLNIAIIGGGYAGMAAGLALASKGIQVTIFESARQLGGRARGVLQHNTQLDNGQHLLLGCYHQTLSVIEQAGGKIDEDFLRMPLQLDLHGHFSLRAPRLPAPLHLLFALLGAKGLSGFERISAARFMLTMRQQNFYIERDTTVARLLAQYGQSDALMQKLWEPLCIAALNTPLKIASARVLLKVLNDSLNQKRTDSDMLIPRLDLTELFPARAARHIKKCGGHILTSCGVEQLHLDSHGMEIVTKRGSLYFSHVICATAPVTAAKLLRPIAELSDTVAQIDALQHQPIYTVYVQYPAHITLPHPMLGLHQRFSQWLFDKGKSSGQQGLIAAVISAEGMHQNLSHEMLAHKVINELHEAFNITAKPLWFKVIADKRATFACTPDLIRPDQRTPLPCLLLSGDYTKGDYPATLEGAVRSGLRCAALLKV